jgi:hypothetical protein
VEVESTIRLAKSRIAGFEGREGHRTPFASVLASLSRSMSYWTVVIASVSEIGAGAMLVLLAIRETALQNRCGFFKFETRISR